MNACEMGIEILRKTNDGEELAPAHLAILQEAVNGWLSELGEVAFSDLYQKVVEGGYQKPWHCDIEHMTKDHEGFIYWKDRQIEHYSFSVDDEGWKRERAEAERLGERCRHLESIGVEVTTTTAVWEWEKYEA